MSSQFTFLCAEFPEIYDAAFRAEALAYPDPRASCFYARRALELAVAWAYRNDSSLQLPYREDLSALIHEPTFTTAVGQAVFQKCRAVKDLGNHAVHSNRPLSKKDAASAVGELFHICYWLVRTYARGEKPRPGIAFQPDALPKTTIVAKQTLAELQEQSDQLAQEREKLFAVLADKDNLDKEIQRLRAEVAAAKKANEKHADTHDYSEEQTRDLFIDLLLKEAGWPLDRPEDREYEVSGMPNEQNQGYVDYVLWDDNGLPLGLVEAKRTKKDARRGQQQAKLYADCLEKEFGQRPVIFYTNGYEHWVWDDTNYPPRAVHGFYKKSELALLIQRRLSKKDLSRATINERIVERYYQTRAIRRIAESFKKDHTRKALLVMATGSGKTRTVIALCDMLMRSNWIKRVLFLCDRTALVTQAVGQFKRHLPDSSPVNLVTEKDKIGRVYVSTYPTILNLIDQTKNEQRPFGVGHFDLVIIDEAHRSIFMKYRSIFEYFDSLLVGLTATPKDEIDRNTYELFDLENGVPTDAYPLNEAVGDGYLVPARPISVPVKFVRKGIIYNDLSAEEKEQFELTDWKEREPDIMPTKQIEAPAINKWLFNRNTVDKVLKHLMERGLKVDGGDKLAKTIIFAKNHNHAVFIADRFNKHYPKYKGEFARVIDFEVEYAQTLIDNFSAPAKMPQIAISVDMLDTGIDVPEVANLVFFKDVKSKTKFWQMVGRGTRLCPNLFGSGKDKESFYLFDYCSNLEYFSQEPATSDGSSGASLSQRLFTARLKLLAELCHTDEGLKIIKEQLGKYADPKTNEEVAKSIVELLKAEVAQMNTANFIVRAKRKLVEKYQNEAIWLDLDLAKLNELEEEIAGLPSEKPAESVEAKQFDLLMLRLQLARLKGQKGFDRMKKQVQEIASALEEASNIPLIKEQLNLIEDIQTDGWWTDVTVPMLELVRLRLRDLVKLIEKAKGSLIETDFEDEMGDEQEIILPGFTDSITFERFKEKARAFLRKHLDNPAIQKLRLNEPLASEDLRALEAILSDSGVGDQKVIGKAAENGLGVFVRSLVGLDREAAKKAVNEFIAGEALSANQIEFVNMIVEYLTENGIMEARMLYESPFTDIAPQGPESLFKPSLVDRLIEALNSIRAKAAA